MESEKIVLTQKKNIFREIKKLIVCKHGPIGIWINIFDAKRWS